MDCTLKASDMIRERNRKITEEFDRLMAEEREKNPLRAAFLPRQYYIRRLHLNSPSGLSENYIAKILNARHRP